MTVLDATCKRVITEKPFMLIPWYLMASYAYYVYDVSLLSDELYDDVCKQLLEKFDTLDHPHKEYVDTEQLEAGTGYAIQYDNLPSMCKSATYANIQTVQTPIRKKKALRTHK